MDLEIPRGEIIGIAGESGSGKSTLAFAIARLLRAPAEITGGSVIYESVDGGRDDLVLLTPKELQPYRWERISMVFQSALNALNPVLTIGAQLDDVLKAHRKGMDKRRRRERVAELLGLVGIAAARAKAYPHELSGGMRQRAMIAMALALDPEVIIMDEPTTALDVVTQRAILREIMSLQKQKNFSIVFITHDLSLLLEIADRVAVMYAGRIVELGTTRELLDFAAHPYTTGLLRSFPMLSGPRQVLEGIPGTPPDLRRSTSGCAFADRCAWAIEHCVSQDPQLEAVHGAPSGQSDHRAACFRAEDVLNASAQRGLAGTR
ncbi:ABC transporter ATP-binding protein [Leifsonia sp. L25]|uniref:ABC transporter ATP-binding protein n=1 Tax=Actinomycetes TaxID=1760 RepID=UPI003D688BEE